MNSNAVFALGDPRDPPILFLHGIRLGRAIWSDHAERLARRYYVLALDLPGHGAHAATPFTQENVRQLITDTIERLAKRPVLLVGYSLGGFVAMRHAVHFPEHTAGLLLAGCTLDLEGWRSWPYRAGVRFSRMLPDAALSMALHVMLAATLPRDYRELVERIPFNRDVLTRTGAIVASSRNALDEIAAYRKPVLVVNGEYDLFSRLDEKRFLHRLPQARLHIMRGVDHTAPLRRSGEFASIVEGFARKIFDA